jgi:starch phosphorylase
VNGIREHDWFMIAADFDSYSAAQRAVDAWRTDRPSWRSAAIRNVARIAWFSSDRTIREYARDIWQAPTA